MSCGCNNEIDTDNPNGNSSCGPCNPCEDSTPTCESLPSALSNFTAHFFGTVTKTLVNGRVGWTLPCNLATGLPDNPRLEDEGLACYFLRLFQNGIVGLTGEKGDTGDTGDDGIDGYTFTASAFLVPTSECPVVQFSVEDADVIPDSAYIFVAGAGWFSVVSRTGTLLMCQLIQATSSSGTNIPAGSFVAITGPEGPQGVRGPKGDSVKGDKGDTGAPGAAGDDGAAAKTETQANYTQPATGDTVLVSVVSSAFFAGNMQVYVSGGGYYTVAAVSPGSLTLRNLGIAASNAAAGAAVPSGSFVVISGVSQVASASEIVATGTTDPSVTAVDGEISFDLTPLEITLPSAGTYEVRMSLTFENDNPAPSYIRARLYNSTTAALQGRYLYISAHGSANDFATGELTQRITVASSTTFVVYAVTDANTTAALSGQCALSWMTVNPVA